MRKRARSTGQERGGAGNILFNYQFCIKLKVLIIKLKWQNKKSNLGENVEKLELENSRQVCEKGKHILNLTD